MSTIGSFPTDPTRIASTEQSGFNALSSDEFVKIIFTELQAQDPLEPNDTSQLLEQLSMLRSIESDVDMMDRLGAIVDQSELAGASSLIGKIISGIDERNERIVDFVVSVSRTANGTVLNTEQGSRVPMKQVDEIIDPLLLTPPPEEIEA